jgi:1-acyl-sn-glycerol-3-phosphate acyltransferase
VRRRGPGRESGTSFPRLPTRVGGISGPHDDAVPWLPRRASLLEATGRAAILAVSRAAVGRRVELRVLGIEHVPARGPVLIASRHVHHFYDAAILMTVISRPLHFLVALDWVHNARERWLMEWACRGVRWPVLLRPERLAGGATEGRRSVPAYAMRDVDPYLRRAVRDAVEILRQGRVLVVFPEAYPEVDPEGSTKVRGEPLPFRAGFARLAALAERDAATRVAIVPAGFDYRAGRRWDVSLRFGPAVYLRAVVGKGGISLAEQAAGLEEAVRALSRPAAGSSPAPPLRAGSDPGRP